MRIQPGQPAINFDVADIFGNQISLNDFKGKKELVPADFLIGPDLIVEKAYYGSDIGDHLPIQEILSWL